MRLRLRAGLAPLAVAVLGLVGAACQPAPPPTLTVTPSTGLEDGQTVTVTGGPFPELVIPVLLQCAEPLDVTDLSSVVTRCDFGPTPSFDAAGNLVPSAFTVHDVITLEGIFGSPPYDCTVRDDCVVAVVGFVGAVSGPLVGAKASISFRPEVPTSRADCLNGGWRSLANDQGQSFGNQGLCLRHVVARRS